MKYLLIVALLISSVGYGQTKYYIRADSTQLEKIGGNNELNLVNSTRSRTGAYLKNTLNGRTGFFYAVDSAYISGTNLVLVRGGGSQNITVPVGSSGTAWNLLGNASTTPGTNFLGTTDDKNLIFKTNNIVAGFIQSESGYNNTAFGTRALLENLNTLNIGNDNSAFGLDALTGNMDGENNVAMGNQALGTNTFGNENSGLGSQSLRLNSTGSGNTAVGYFALAAVQTSDYNIGIGHVSGGSITTGSNNIFIGTSSGSVGQKVDAVNSIGIGKDVVTTADNQVVIGNSSITQTKLRGMLYFDGATGTAAQSIRVNAGATGMEYYTPSTVATAVPISGLTAATATNDISNGTLLQEWRWPTLAGNSGLKLSSVSTAAVSGAQRLLHVRLEGTNSNSSQATYGVYSENVHAGTGSQNYSIYGTSSGGASVNVGVYGAATGTGSYGVYAFTNSASGVSIFAENTGTSGTGYALQAKKTGAATLNIAGQFEASGGTTNNAINIVSGALTLNSSAGISGQVLTSAGANTLPTWSTASGGTPAGNFGNLQIGRNGAFDTPASDSLDFESATGLSVKGLVNTTVAFRAANGTLAAPSHSFTNTTGTGLYYDGTYYGEAMGGVPIRNTFVSGGGSGFVQMDFSGPSTVNLGDGKSYTSFIGGDSYGTSGIFEAGAASLIANSGLANGFNIGASNAAGVIDFYTGGAAAGNLRMTISAAGSVALTGRLLKSQGADVASTAGAMTLGTDGNSFEITGTNSITLLSNVGWVNGSEVTLIFTSTATLTDGTANSGTDIGMELAGNANFVASAGATVKLLLSEIGGTQRWREVGRSVN